MNATGASDGGTGSAPNRICNPPMVHHASFSPSGRIAAAALGDGSISITAVGARGFGTTLRLPDAHGGLPVASVAFGSWNDGHRNPRVDADDRLLCSAGNDGTIAYWDLGTALCGNKAPLLVEQFLQRLDLRDDGPVPAGDAGAADATTPLGEGQPRMLFAIQHGTKPNWMVSSRCTDPFFPSTLFVADTSNDITAYTIPLSS
jgi:WD40 repeat protein